MTKQQEVYFLALQIAREKRVSSHEEIYKIYEELLKRKGLAVKEKKEDIRANISRPIQKTIQSKKIISMPKIQKKLNSKPPVDPTFQQAIGGC